MAARPVYAADLIKFPPRAGTLTVLLALCVAMIVSALGVSLYGMADFGEFYRTARIWLDTSRYEASTGGFANLNLPIFTIAVLPFAWLPPWPAWLLWQSAQLSCFGWLIWRARAHFTGPMLLVLLLSPAILAQLGLGQMAAFLAVLLTEAWIADRRQAQSTAGIWFGVALALKVFLVPVLTWWAVRGRWRSVGQALLVTMSLTVAGVLLFGTAAYRSWYDATQRIAWDSLPLNASLWGLVKRAVGVEWVLPVWMACATVVSAVTAWGTWRRGNAAAWAGLLLACILLSPLGWCYYQVIVLVPLVMLARSHQLVRLSVVLLWVPPAIGWNIAALAQLAVWSACVATARKLSPSD